MLSCFVVHCAEPSPAPEHYSFPRGRCKTDRFPGPCRTMANRVWGVGRGPGKGSTLPALPLLPVFVRKLCPRPLSAGWVHVLCPLVGSTSFVRWLGPRPLSAGWVHVICPLIVSTSCVCLLVVSTSCVCPLLCLSAGCVHIMCLSAGCVHILCLSAGCVHILCLSALSTSCWLCPHHVFVR